MSTNIESIKDYLLIIYGKIKAFGEEAKKEALKNNIKTSESGNKLFAPLLVDSNSILKYPKKIN